VIKRRKTTATNVGLAIEFILAAVFVRKTPSFKHSVFGNFGGNSCEFLPHKRLWLFCRRVKNQHFFAENLQKSPKKDKTVTKL
jgi:hypothetical protein